MVISCQNISKSFGIDEILNNVTFNINEGEKVAIVGINGAGKSTLLKIIIDELSADSGMVVKAKDVTVGYLSQQSDLTGDNTIYDEVLSVRADVLAIEERIRSLEHEMAGLSSDGLESVMKQYASLQAEFERHNGYEIKSRVNGVLKGLGFVEDAFNMHVGTLSGGQKTRVALSKLLLREPNLIILDEPTNHLDLNATAWLEGFLSNYKGAVLVVSHDRYFLDAMVTRVIELENTHATIFNGNYSFYAKQKAELRKQQLHHYLSQQQEIKHQEEVIAKLKSFNREKSIKRAESREKMLNKIERLEKPVELNDKMHIRLEPNILSGNDVMTVSSLAKRFGGNRLFEDLSFEIKRGDKVALIGDNGTGKTTLLKIINGLMDADRGEITLGAKVFIGYYDQEHHVLDASKTAFSEIQDTYPSLDNTKVRNTLAAFLFTGDDVFKLIADLSGGEKGRLSLAKLMLSDANLLILDEPTNHLDIASKEILEDAISSYEGTVLCVSHDRYFINRTATRVFELKDRNIKVYNGNYDYYLSEREKQQAVTSDGMTRGTSESAGKADWAEKKQEQARIRKQQNDMKKAEEAIERLEAEIAKIDEELSDEKNATDAAKLMELSQAKEKCEEELMEAMELWDSLT